MSKYKAHKITFHFNFRLFISITVKNCWSKSKIKTWESTSFRVKFEYLHFLKTTFTHNVEKSVMLCVPGGMIVSWTMHDYFYHFLLRSEIKYNKKYSCDLPTSCHSFIVIIKGKVQTVQKDSELSHLVTTRIDSVSSIRQCRTLVPWQVIIGSSFYWQPVWIRVLLN